MADSDLTLEDDAPERDENTADIFGAPAPAPSQIAASESAPYTVIARKYRPKTFEDLIGQEAMVRTLKNAFASGRIAHAFMLTGVRGVGKTTTARLLARALNYESDTVHQPSVDLAVEGYHCASIIAGRNLSVLEIDAASQSKVDEMRDLLAGVNTVPVGTRYKVYVIDEVHMLSTAAFNALLKTLEEPPPHAKFIFATTEIRKVPVTILLPLPAVRPAPGGAGSDRQMPGGDLPGGRRAGGSGGPRFDRPRGGGLGPRRAEPAGSGHRPGRSRPARHRRDRA